MAVTAIKVAKKEDLPADLQTEAKEVDGMWEVEVDLDNSKLTSALQAERQSLKDLKTKYKGLDLDEARTAMAKIKELGDLDPVKAREAIAAMESGNPQELQRLHKEALDRMEMDNQNKMAVVQGQLTEMMLQNQASAILSESGASVPLLQPHVMKSDSSPRRAKTGSSTS